MWFELSATRGSRGGAAQQAVPSKDCHCLTVRCPSFEAAVSPEEHLGWDKLPITHHERILDWDLPSKCPWTERPQRDCQAGTLRVHLRHSRGAPSQWETETFQRDPQTETLETSVLEKPWNRDSLRGVPRSRHLQTPQWRPKVHRSPRRRPAEGHWEVYFDLRV